MSTVLLIAAALVALLVFRRRLAGVLSVATSWSGKLVVPALILLYLNLLSLTWAVGVLAIHYGLKALRWWANRGESDKLADKIDPYVGHRLPQQQQWMSNVILSLIHI